jgi:uncharacterized protein YjiS (DUF1127 family)
MDALMTKQEVDSLMFRPASPATTGVQAIRARAAQAHDVAVLAGFTGLFERLVQAVGFWFVSRRAAEELGALTDRELADIGLSRSDIPAVLAGQRR